MTQSLTLKYPAEATRTDARVETDVKSVGDALSVASKNGWSKFAVLTLDGRLIAKLVPCGTVHQRYWRVE